MIFHLTQWVRTPWNVAEIYEEFPFDPSFPLVFTNRWSASASSDFQLISSRSCPWRGHRSRPTAYDPLLRRLRLSHLSILVNWSKTTHGSKLCQNLWKTKNLIIFKCPCSFAKSSFLPIVSYWDQIILSQASSFKVWVLNCGRYQKQRLVASSSYGPSEKKRYHTRAFGHSHFFIEV